MLTAWLPRLRLARAVSAARRLHVGIGLESTYDDSAAAVVDGAGRVISDVRLSQDHTRYASNPHSPTHPAGGPGNLTESGWRLWRFFVAGILVGWNCTDIAQHFRSARAEGTETPQKMCGFAFQKLS